MGSQNGDVEPAVSVIPRRNTLPAVENIRLHRGTLDAKSALTAFLIRRFSAALVSFQLTHADPFEIAHLTRFLFFKRTSDSIGPRSLVVPRRLCVLPLTPPPPPHLTHSFPFPLSLIVML